MLLIVVVLFILAAFGIVMGGISLVELGLACFAGAFFVPETSFGRR